MRAPGVGLEPTTYGLTVRRAANCATRDRARSTLDKRGDSALDLRMAIRTEQHAFRRFGAHGGHRLGESPHPQRKGLDRWIEVMELERADVAVVSADRAAATGLLDEHPLHTPPAGGDALRSALGATQPVTVDHEPDTPMPSTDPLTTGDPRRTAGSAVERREPVLPEPVADGRIALARPSGDLPDGEPCVHESFKIVPFHSLILSIRADGKSEHMFPIVATSYSLARPHATSQWLARKQA